MTKGDAVCDGQHRYHTVECFVDNKVIHVVSICTQCADLQVRTADLNSKTQKE